MLHERVAFRYFNKVGGLFEAPPKLLEDVTRFLLARYTGHVLAKVNRKIEQLRKDGDGPDYEQMMETVENDYRDKDFRNISEGGEMSFLLRPDINKEMLIFRGDGWWSYQYTEGGRPKGREYGPYKAWELSKKVYNAVNKAYNELFRKSRERGVSKDDDVQLVELVRVQRLCRKYTKKARAYKSTARTDISVDLTGWKYIEDELQKARHTLQSRIDKLSDLDFDKRLSALNAGDTAKFDLRGFYGSGIALHSMGKRANVTCLGEDEFKISFPGSSFGDINGVNQHVATSFLETETQEIIDSCKEALAAINWKKVREQLGHSKYAEIQAILNFKGHTKRGGQWDESKQQLEVDMPKDAWTVKELEKSILSIIDTAEHECQHVGQTILQQLKGLKEEAGLPSKDIRNLVYTPNGYGRRRRKDHALRDIEFYTRLTHEVGAFISVVSKVPFEYRRHALRLWTADPNPQDQEMIDQLNEMLPIRERNSMSRKFFKSLKRREPEKWEKAVKEFVSELNSRGFRLPPE